MEFAVMASGAMIGVTVNKHGCILRRQVWSLA